SLGSIGHPFICGRPCVAFQGTGECEHGPHCAHCHHPCHESISVGARQLRNLRTICKQDVRDRENLQHLVLLVLAERLQAMQMTAVAGPTIEALFSLLTPRSAGRSRAERNLYKYLRRMGFAQLMSVLAHTGCEHVADSLESAFHQIRAQCRRESQDQWQWN
ncbi:unnamed protein product, partial [Symbiodinium sp. KB8]